MKDIKLRIKSVESTMQITKAMELVASSKMRRAKERVEHSRPYFETLHKTLTEIAAADPRARNPYLRRAEIKKTLLIVIAGDRGLAGGYNSNVLRQAQQEAGDVVVLPIGKRSAEYFVHHEVPLFTQEVLLGEQGHLAVDALMLVGKGHVPSPPHDLIRAVCPRHASFIHPSVSQNTRKCKNALRPRPPSKTMLYCKGVYPQGFF